MTVLDVPSYASVEDLLAAARAGIRRFTPAETVERVAHGALVVDIRPAWQRAVDGEVPGSWVVERNHLEWRLHPASGASLPVASPAQEWVVLCTKGCTSSLAAASLTALGLRAADVVGGIRAWRADGFEIAVGPSPVETVVQPDPTQTPQTRTGIVRRGAP